MCTATSSSAFLGYLLPLAAFKPNAEKLSALGEQRFRNACGMSSGWPKSLVDSRLKFWQKTSQANPRLDLKLCTGCRSPHFLQSLPTGLVQISTLISLGLTHIREHAGERLLDWYITSHAILADSLSADPSPPC